MDTDYSLRRRGTRGPETELAQLVARLGGEGVESRFRGLEGGEGALVSCWRVLGSSTDSTMFYLRPL